MRPAVAVASRCGSAMKMKHRDSIGDALKTLALRASKKNLELAYQIDVDVPDFLVGDSSRLRQVIPTK